MQNLGIGLLGGFIGMSHGLWMRRETNDRSFGEAVYVRFSQFLEKKESPLAQNIPGDVEQGANLDGNGKTEGN